MYPLISIVVPTLNRVGKLKNSIDSILKNEYKNIELIIIDNGSSDETIEYLQGLNIVNLKTIFNENNLGLAHARNQGIIESKGEYILFIDDDNVIDKTMVITLFNFFKKNEKVGIVTPKTFYKNQPNKIWFFGATINKYTSKAKFYYPNVVDREDRINHNIKINCAHNCFMVRKVLFDKLGIFDENLFVSYTEFDLCMRARKYYQVYVCGKAKCYHDRLDTEKNNSVESYGFTNIYRVYYLIRNRAIMIKRYASLFQLIVFCIIFYPLFFFFYGFVLYKFKRIDYLKYHMRGFYAGLKYIFQNKLVYIEPEKSSVYYH